jgi:hypothetical protein
VPASGQRALLGVEIFGKGIAGKTGWVELESSSAAVKGFFLTFDSAVTFIDGAALVTAPASRLVFPKVSGSLTSPTTIAIAHVASTELQGASITMYDNDGSLVNRTPLNLSAKSGFMGSITELMPEAAGREGYSPHKAVMSPDSCW